MTDNSADCEGAVPQSADARTRIASQSQRQEQRSAASRWLWRVVFSLVPVCVLVASTEVFFRLGEARWPRLQTLPLPEEELGLLVPDDTLFWKLKPSVQVDPSGQNPNAFRTNALGLRDDEVRPKQPGEVRILSLGESTTFGFGVPMTATYSAQLEKLLNSRFTKPKFNVLNAGVPAWSSWQSLKFLETMGWGLEPDLLLFYHEINDYLPASHRASNQAAWGATLSDAQLDGSRRHQAERWLLAHSATFRFLVFRRSERKLAELQNEPTSVKPGEIGIDDLGTQPRLTSANSAQAVEYNEQALPTRVLREERRANFDRLLAECRARGVKLVVLHPAYRRTARHECLLTKWCSETQTPMYETFFAVHPDDLPRGALFIDGMHPNAEGHARIARGLANFLRNQKMLEPSTR